MANKSIVPGSISAIAQKTGQPLAETFMNADVLILVDQSSSMITLDAPGNKSRYAAAESDVIRLQEKYSGRIAVLSFSNGTRWNPNGVPDRIGGSTDMAEALEYIRICDDTGMKLILVSDGEPDDAEKTLKVARKFRSPIETIFVGNEVSGGHNFLQQLASVTGGSFSKSASPGLLAQEVETLMLTG